MTNALASNSILQNLYFDNLAKMNMAAADRAQAQSLVASVAAVMDAFDRDAVAINGDGDRSAQGRASALVALSKMALGQLAALTAPTMAALDAQIVGHGRALRQAAAGPDASAITELRAVEARAAFGQVDHLMRPGQYLALCQSGADDQACAAVENNPFVSLLPPDVIEAGRAVRAARALPDQAKALDTASDLRTLLVASTAAARRHMSLGALVDPLQVASLTEAQIDDQGDEQAA
jgi:hypothetical protein